MTTDLKPFDESVDFPVNLKLGYGSIKQMMKPEISKVPKKKIFLSNNVEQFKCYKEGAQSCR
jgi:hypothetical protein